MKREAILAALAALLTVFTASHSIAGWKEDQAALFQQIPVKPGDKIDKSNWEKVKDLLPASMVEYVKRGDFVINIAELKWDYGPDEEWRKKTAANAGKYEVAEDGLLIEKATGKLPNYVDGEPFPDIDWKNDPQAGIKTAHNMTLGRRRGGTVISQWTTTGVGRGGSERSTFGDWITYNYWARPDGPTNNPQNLLLASLIKVKKPYDLAGIVTLNQRTIDDSPDQSHSYVPAKRAVKKVPGTTRSNPFLGSDFSNDDSFNWYGKNETMEWKVIDKKIVLMPLQQYNVEGPLRYIQQPNGGWVNPPHANNTRPGYRVEGWEGAPWAPVDLVYVPRMLYVVKANPKDPNYNYGEITYYVDEFQSYVYKIVKDRAGDHWKTLLATFDAAQWDGHITATYTDWALAIDDKSDHATWNDNLGLHNGNLHKIVFNSPNITKGLFSPINLQAQSK